jgi:cytochrome c oxidase subunit I+III
MPGPSWPTVLAAFGTAGFFLFLTVKMVIPGVLCGILAFWMVWKWLWSTDPGPSHPPVGIGGGITLPVHKTGASSHSWWAMIVLILVSGSMFASLLFGYLFLWTVSPEVWPADTSELPKLAWPLTSSALLIASCACVAWVSRRLTSGKASLKLPLGTALGIGSVLLIAATVVELLGQQRAGLSPTESAYGAMVYTLFSLQAFYVGIVAIMGIYTIARTWSGLLNGVRRSTFDNTMLMWYYTIAQGLIATALVHSFPRLVG